MCKTSSYKKQSVRPIFFENEQNLWRLVYCLFDVRTPSLLFFATLLTPIPFHIISLRMRF